VIANYRRWLWERLQEPGSPQERELLCWCHPLPCHAEVVLGAVLWLAGEGQRIQAKEAVLRERKTYNPHGH
jgi:hypothetical protein